MMLHRLFAKKIKAAEVPPKLLWPRVMLNVGLALNVVAVIAFSLHQYGVYRESEVSERVNLKAHELQSTIAHLDEVLTMSACMAAVTGDRMWEDRYRRFEPALDAAIKDAARLAPRGNGDAAALVTDQANANLVAMEKRAFDLVRQGRKDQAREVLFGAEYEGQKGVYAQGMAALAEGLASSVEANLVKKRHEAYLGVVIAGALIAFTIVVWLMLLAAIRHWSLALQREKALSDNINRTLRLSESRLEALLKLAEKSDASLHEIIDYALDEAVRLTGSTIGYLGFMSKDERVLTINAWSKSVMAQCVMDDKPIVFPIEKLGLLGEAVRHRRPIITNDYESPNAAKRGYPSGHLQIKRYMSIPVLDAGRIVAVAAVGNKVAEYDDSDVRQLQLLMDGMWRLIQQKQVRDYRREQERLAHHEAVRAMERVLGVVGHELRTPLAGLRVTSEFLLINGAHGSDQRQTFLENMNAEIVRMTDTVDCLLEAARLNSGRAQWTWSQFDLRSVCEEAIAGIRPLIHNDAVALIFDADPASILMLGDSNAVRRLVLNLLDNSRKHTAHGEIRVTIRAQRLDQHDHAEIRVQDTGEGIRPPVMSKLGEAFALNSGAVGTDHVSGTGLGLAICKGIVGAHGGRMSINSAKAQGTVVSVVLRTDLAAPINGAAPKLDTSHEMVGIAEVCDVDNPSR